MTRKGWQTDPSDCLLDVLQVLMRGAGGNVELTAHDMMVGARRGSREVYYRAILPLEAAGWLTRRDINDDEPSLVQRWPRWYHLTPFGVAQASTLLTTHRPPGSPPSLRHRVLDTIALLGPPGRAVDRFFSGVPLSK